MKQNHNKTNGMKINTKKSPKTIKKGKVSTDLDQPILTPPKIDKLSLVIEMKDIKLLGHTHEGLIEAFADPEENIIKAQGSFRYPTAGRILCPDQDGLIHLKSRNIFIQVMSTKHPNPHIRLEFNPVELFGSINNVENVEKPDALIMYLDLLFGLLCGSLFWDLLAHARVSKIDICRDILFRHPEDYLIRVKHAQTSQCVFGSDGKLETMYCGKRKGNQFKIYDKAKEMHGKQALHPSTRIEGQRTKCGVSIGGLYALENPFKRVEIYSLKVDQPPSGIAHWSAFRDACRFRGINNAIKLQPKNMQAKLRKAMRDSEVDWWQLSGEDWDMLWPEAMREACLDQVPAHGTPLTIAYVNGQGF